MNRSYPVYIVDDDASVIGWIEALCEELGFPYRSYASGGRFLEEVEGLEPGCILLDMRMPRLSGLKVQAELVKKEIRLPVIAMTGFGDVEQAVASMKLGAIEYLEKPIENEVLAEALNQAFELLAKQDQGPE